jgi:tetratricopeptide (TPR) repeat protein
MSSRSARELGGLLVLCVVAFAAQAAAPPAELTREQKAKLAQRDRLVESLPDLVRKGHGNRALEAAERIVALEKEVLGETDGRVIASLQRLAQGREALGQYVKAIRLRKEVVRLLEKGLGKDHWQTTDARLALQDSRRLAGLSPEDRAALLQAVADTYRAVQLHQQGRSREAVPIAVQVMAAYRKLLGEKHPDYARSLNNLAELYRVLGEYGKALPLYLEARDLRRQVLGQKHPHYATSLSNLAGIYHDMGEQSKAFACAREAVGVLHSFLGDSFDSLGELPRLQITAHVLHNLGVLLSLQEQAMRPAAERYSAVLSWKGRPSAASSTGCSWLTPD